MNTQKNIDYSNLIAVVDQTLDRKLPQLTLYFQIGKLLDRQPEAGAVAAVAKYLAEQHPDLRGFSPRSLRRMRAFYRTYKNQPCALLKAMRLGWTQNIVIFEADLTAAEREWYINAAYQFGWSKMELTRKIAEKAHLNPTNSETTAAKVSNGYTPASLLHINGTNDNGQHIDSTCEMRDTDGFQLHPRPRIPASSDIRRLDLKQIARLYFPKIKAGRTSAPVIQPIKDMSDIEQIANLCWKKNEPIYLTKNGYTNLVVMSMEIYE